MPPHGGEFKRHIHIWAFSLIINHINEIGIQVNLINRELPRHQFSIKLTRIVTNE